MPHRLFDIGNLYSWIAGIVSGGIGLLTSAEWDRVLGSQGGYVLCVIGIVVLWSHSKNQSRKAERERDRRHRESLITQAETTTRIETLFNKLADIKISNVEINTKLDATLNRLTEQLNNRPCQNLALVSLLRKLREEKQKQQQTTV